MKSKKRISFIAIILVVLSLLVYGVIVLIDASDNKPDFTLTAVSSSQTVKSGDPFSVTVYVKANRRYTFEWGSPYAAGPILEIYLETEGETHLLKSGAIAFYDDGDPYTVEHGEIFSPERKFEALIKNKDGEGYVPAPPGNYTLKMSFIEQEIIENFITITD